MKNNPLFTVCTPTYNRERTLHRVYQSLMQQTFHDFEWLIIDDGSTDETEERVDSWQKDGATWFSIRYKWFAHGHKKTAHNHALGEAKGELLLPLDSDDSCMPQALERFAYHWFAIPRDKRDGFSAVTALCAFEDKSIVGDRFPCNSWINSDSSEMNYYYGVMGEKWGFQRLDVLKKFPFPDELPGHVPEGIVWSQISKLYKTRYINEVLRIYHQDTAGDEQQVTKSKGSVNAPGLLHWKQQILSDDIGWFRYKRMFFILDAARLTRYYCHCPEKYRSKFWPGSGLGKTLVAIMLPLGVAWYWYDRLIKK